MPPPADFEILRAQDALRGAGGETKEELLRRASAERTSRANERRRKHGALTVQRMWRGATSRARSRAATLARWDERYGDARTSPAPAELFDELMPPLHFVGSARAGATRTLRALALALCTSNLCAEETKTSVLHYSAKTRRLKNFALDALTANVGDVSDGMNSIDTNKGTTGKPRSASECDAKIEGSVCEQRRATRECATRLLAAIDAEEKLLNCSIDVALAYNARVCDVAASLIRARDASVCAKTLVRVAVDGCVSRDVAVNGECVAGDGVSAMTFSETFSARAAMNVAARLFGAKETALHLVAQTTWFSRLVVRDESRDASVSGSVSYEALESFLAAFRRLSSAEDVSFDPVAAANNLVWLVAGWHPPSGLEPAPPFKAARARLASLPRSTVCAFVETLERLLAVTHSGDESVSSSDFRIQSRYANVPALREAWFVAGVAREGDDASLDATASLYWRACREKETNGALLSSSSNRDSEDSETREKAQRLTSAALLSRRRRLLGALAFAPGTVRRLWMRCASRAPAAVSLGADDATESLWTCPAVALGVASLDAEVLPTVGLFALAYAHLLEVLDDDEFTNADKTPFFFTSSEQRAVAAFANMLVVRERLRVRAPERFIAKTRRGKLDDGDTNIDRKKVTDACASLLRALVTRDERRKFAPDGLWLAPARVDNSSAREIGSPLPPEAAAAALLGASDDGSSSGFALFLRDCPHALSFETRFEIFRALVKLDRERLGLGAQAGGVDADRATQGQRVVPVSHFRVRRTCALEDTLANVLPLGSKLKGRIAVTFVNAAGLEESGIDAGGLFKELLEVSLAELVDPRRGLWSQSQSEESSPSPSSSSSNGSSIYPDARAGGDHTNSALLELSGLLFGKALYEGVVHRFSLAPFFAKKLVRKPLSLDDLPGLDGTLHKSLKQVLKYSGDVTDLCLDWYVREEVFGEVVSSNLRPGEKTPDDVVESHETLAWAHATAEFFLVRRRLKADTAFERGLFKMVHPSWLKLFGANELGALMCGDADGDVDVDDLRKHCAFGGGYGENSRTVLMFWQCVEKEFTKEERRALLKFVTSSASPPVRGFEHLHPPFTIHKVTCDGEIGGYFGKTLAKLGLAKDVERLPTASTCFNVLKLPNFRRLETMKAKLRTAIEAGAGFELS